MAKANLKPALGNVIPFPDMMSSMPHRSDNYLRKPSEMWTPPDKVDEARATLASWIAKRDAHLENGTTDTREYITAMLAVDIWTETVEERQAAAADATLNYAGKIYAQPMGAC